jgi:hypothetical protein
MEKIPDPFHEFITIADLPQGPRSESTRDTLRIAQIKQMVTVGSQY